MNVIDWILNLFRDHNAASAFVMAPGQVMTDAGLGGISPVQLASVASTAVPGLMLGSDPVVGLQRAVSNYHGFDNGYGYNGFSNGYSYAQPAGYAPTYAPNVASPTWAPQNTLAAQTDLASHNSTSLMSPDQYAGANSQQGGFNLGFGDITLGSKTTASNGAAVINGNNRGDIVSGDGAVLGNGNSVTNGDTWAGAGANVNQGHGVLHSVGNDTNTGSGSMIKGNDGPVLQNVDASGGNGGAAGGGSGSGGLLGVGIGNSSHGGNAGGGGITFVSKDTGNTVGGDQSHVTGVGNSTANPTHVVSQPHNTVVNDSYNPSHTTAVSSTTNTGFDNGNHAVQPTLGSLAGQPAVDHSTVQPVLGNHAVQPVIAAPSPLPVHSTQPVLGTNHGYDANAGYQPQPSHSVYDGGSSHSVFGGGHAATPVADAGGHAGLTGSEHHGLGL
ncbi:MAG: IniB N-terminal domain-containing protein [Mycolicibacterium insubricum]|nr:IniB N-terminal domain-containing protein [Mycobacterium sp.]